MRQVEYSLKDTMASTQYVLINHDDTNFLQNTFIKYIAGFGELSNIKEPNCKLIVKDYWNRIHKKLPKSKHGYNTPNSFISGILNNLLFRNQNNLSLIILPGIECVSVEVFELWQALEEETHIRVNGVEAITFIQDVRPITFI